MFATLVKEHRVIAPDLRGYGKSDRRTIRRSTAVKNRRAWSVSSIPYLVN
jgi:pimeloyl-ACP methyl ester carboxylesterase